MASEERILKGLTVLAAVFPNAKITEQTLQIYAGDLSDIPETLLDSALAECRVTCEFFPTIRAIRDTAARLSLGERLEALEAWALVAKAARYGNPVSQPDFGNELTNESTRILGWRNYLNSDINDEPSWRARFCEIYNQLRERQVRDVRSLPEVREYRRLASGAQPLGEAIKALTNGDN